MDVNEFYSKLDKDFEEYLVNGKLMVGIELSNSLFQEKFNNAVEINLVEKLRFSYDYDFILQKILDWKSKSKNDKQKEILSKIENALIRIFLYEFNQENNIKSFIAMYQHEKALNNFLKDKLSKMHSENISLKSEIEFMIKNGS